MPHPEAPEGEDRPPEEERATFSRADFGRLRLAVRERWGVPDTLRTEALFQAARILADPKGKARNKLAAMRFLGSLDLAERREDRHEPAGTRDDETTGVDPARAEAALKALNEESQSHEPPEKPPPA